MTTDNSAHNDLITSWAQVYLYANFKYEADIQIQLITANMTLISNNLGAIQTNNINKIELSLNTLSTIVTALEETFPKASDGAIALPGKATAITGGVGSFITQLTGDIDAVVQASITNIIGDVLVNNPASGFGDCKPLAQDVKYLLDGICEGLLGGLSGLWLSLAIVNIVSIFTLISSLRTGKRMEFMRYNAKFAKIGDRMLVTPKSRDDDHILDDDESL